MQDTREMLADFFGCAFLVIGILMALLSGGCVGIMLLARINDPTTMAAAAFVFVASIAVAVGGNRLANPKKLSRPPPDS